MSTTETAVAEEQEKKRSPSERATALGAGIVRLSDGSYLRPQQVEVHVQCSGPLAYWKVKGRFPALADEGDESPLLLYPLPGEAALKKVVVGEETLLPGALQVRSIEELPEETPLSVPPTSLIVDFGDEKKPVLSLQLDPWVETATADGLSFELEYASGLPTEDGRIQLRIPSVVSDKLQAAGQTAMSLTVVIEEGTELVDEPTFPAGVQSAQEGEVVTLSGNLESLDEAVVVTFRPGRTQMPVRRLLRGENHFIFSIYPPTSIPASPQRRDIVFAVDASENLDPNQFTQIKAEMCETLRKLDENDRFALVTFGRDIDGYDGGEFCDIEQVEAACQWLQQIEPKGRPDVQPLLQRIQSLPVQEDRQLCIFLIAGGHVGNEPAILKSLEFDQSDRRYYTVGIGQSVQQSFLRRLALLTRGRCEVSLNGGCSEAVERLLGQTRALLAEVDFEDQDGEVEFDSEQLVPSKMTSLTPQGPVHCLGTGSPSALRFRSKDETGVFFAGTVNAQSTENPALGGVWAGLRVREMLDSVNLTTGAKKKALRSEAASLAAEYGILTEDTVIVQENEHGPVVQYSALPTVWRGAEPKEKKNSVSNKDGAAPFDWRKGLVAREGLFKGKSPGDSGESTGRYGLRTKGGGSSESSGKPRLDRAVLTATTSDDEDVEIDDLDGALEEVAQVTPEAVEQAETSVVDEADSPGEVSQAGEPEQVTEAQAATEDVSVAQPPPVPAPAQPAAAAPVPPTPSDDAAPVAVPTPQAPVVHLRADAFSAGRLRMESYYSQLDSYDTELSLAAIQGLPGELSPDGGDLPRILAQTVAHLEKRGYYSHAVSVLGLLLKDSPSPEVYKKMESLLGEWADSLPEEKLPEIIQILQLGARACHGSEFLLQKATEAHQRWQAVAGQQSELPSVTRLRQQQPEQEMETLLSQPQLELAKLKEEQAEMARQMAEMRQTMQQQINELAQQLQLDELKQQVAALPAMLEKLISQSPAPAVSSAPAVTTVPSPPVPQAAPVSAPTEEAVFEEELEVPSPDELDEPEPTPAAAAPEPTPPAAAPVAAEPVPAPVAPQEAEPTPAPVNIPLPTAAEPPPEQTATPPTPEPTPAPPVVEAELQDEELPEAPAESETAAVAPAPPEPAAPVVEDSDGPEVEELGHDMALTKEELTEMLLADPRSEDSREAVMVSLKDPKDRVNFFRDMVKADKSEPYHSLSLARAYREADQTKVAVVHYQKFLRAEKDAQAYLELADAYDELGKANLSASARKAAEAFKTD